MANKLLSELKKKAPVMSKAKPGSEDELEMAYFGEEGPEVTVELEGMGEGAMMAQGEGEEQGDDDFTVAQPVNQASIPPELQKMIDEKKITPEILQAALDKMQAEPEEMELA